MMSIGCQRLLNQQIARQSHATPSQLVRFMGALQAQDYLGGLWAVGLRVPHATEQQIEQALAERTIVRTWPMRGTIHLVAADDMRWMLQLLTPRVVRSTQGRLRGLGLDAATLARSADVVQAALAGRKELTRAALRVELEAAGIAADAMRGLHILGHLAHLQLICFGARAGKQPTFALVDEWLPPTPAVPRDEALARLALRYFTSHGPATLHDFMWWAGLTTADARAGVGAVATQLAQQQVDGQTYFGPLDPPAAAIEPGAAWLLPPFDEFLVAYRDRSASLDRQYTNRVTPGSNGIFNPIVVIDGRVEGIWKREFKKNQVLMTFAPFTVWSSAARDAIARAAEHYGQYVGKTPVVAFVDAA